MTADQSSNMENRPLGGLKVPPANKFIENLRTPDRQPSPQPTHLNASGNVQNHRVLHEQGTGYVAPKFEGKNEQMDKYVFSLVYDSG
jgi:glutamate dehydrogenase